MSHLSRHALLFIGVVVFVVSPNTEIDAQPGYVPALQNSPRLWQMPFGGVFPPVSGSALPVQQDPRRALIAGRTWHIADLSNPNLKAWARDHLKKDIEEIDKGKIQFTASSSCLPPGVPTAPVSEVSLEKSWMTGRIASLPDLGGQSARPATSSEDRGDEHPQRLERPPC